MTFFSADQSPPAWLRFCRRAVLVLLAWSLPTSLFGMQAGLILGVLILLGLGFATRFNQFSRSPLDVPFGMLVLAVLLSLLLSDSGATSWHTATSFWLWPTFYVVFFAVKSERSLRLAVNGLLILSVLVAAFGVYQSFSGQFPFGEAIHPGVRPLLRRVDSAPGRYAAVGLFYSRVTLAHVLLFPICWMSALLLEAFSFRIRLFLGTGLLLAWIGMLCTWTRVAPVAATIAALGLLWIRLKPTPVRKKAALLVVLVIVCGGFVLAPGLVTRVQKSFSGTRDWGRLAIWQTAMDLVSEHPVTGIGFGNFNRDAAPLLEQRVAEIGETKFAGVLAWAHNDLMTFLVECGFVGGFCFCWLFVAYFLSVRRGLRKVPPDKVWLRGFVRGSIAAVAAYLLTSLFHDNFFHGEIAFTLWFTLGSSLAALKLSNRGGEA